MDTSESLVKFLNICTYWEELEQVLEMALYAAEY